MIFTLEYCEVNAIENAPFKIERPDGSYRHIFFHFTSQVTININGEDIICSPGTCILFEPKVFQYFHVEKNRLNHDYIDFTLENPNFFKDLNFPLNTPFNPKCSKEINDAINQICFEKNSLEIGANYRSQALMLDLFVSISRKFHFRKMYANEKYTNIQKAKFEEIRLSLYQAPDQLKVSSIAKKMGFSVSRFNDLYKKYFNCTPIDDLTEARIIRVKELIEEGCTTKEIIKTLGFSSDEYFYRWFKKHFKTTKNDYINNKINTED